MSDVRPRIRAHSPATESVDVSGRARAEVAALSTCSGRPACARKVIDFPCAFDDRFSIGLCGLELCTRFG